MTIGVPAAFIRGRSVIRTFSCAILTVHLDCRFAIRALRIPYRLISFEAAAQRRDAVLASCRLRKCGVASTGNPAPACASLKRSSLVRGPGPYYGSRHEPKPIHLINNDALSAALFQL